MKIDIVNDYKKINNIIERCDSSFSNVIKTRGYEYYNDNNILYCNKNNNKYEAKVEGSEDEPYDVCIEFIDDDIHYSCTCPCDYPCKHEYAVIIALSKGEYTEYELKDSIKEKGNDMKDTINDIPAEEIKQYIMSLDNIPFNSSFKDYFAKYYPTQSYEYYYNNLYNTLLLDGYYEELTNNYLLSIKGYINNQNFIESFKIIKSIIEAYKDTNNIDNDDYISDILLNIGMYLRVTYRKIDSKKEIDTWIETLSKNNYYNNYYLEDIILNIK